MATFTFPNQVLTAAAMAVLTVHEQSWASAHVTPSLKKWPGTLGPEEAALCCQTRMSNLLCGPIR